MEFFKKHQKTILVILVIAILVWYFFLRKKKVVAPVVEPKKEGESNWKNGDRIGKDCYCNGVFSPDCCKKYPNAVNIGDFGSYKEYLNAPRPSVAQPHR